MIIDITTDENFNQMISGSRAREVFEMDTKLSYDNLIIYGEAGSGKTALLKAFTKLNPRNFQNVFYYRGYDVETNEAILAPHTMNIAKHHDGHPRDLLIIDGFDEIRSIAIKEKIAHLMQARHHGNCRVVLSARAEIREKFFERYTSTLRLKGLDRIEVGKLVDEIARQYGKHPDFVQPIRKLLSSLNGNPGQIMFALTLLLNQSEDGAKQLVYRNPVVIEELQKPTIILQEAPKLITDIRVVNQRILDKINRKPEAIYQLKPRQFEMLVAELFEERGYKVELTQQTRDGGKDLIILDNREIGNMMIYAECKRYAPDNPVGVSVVSDLIGRMSADRATAGIVVTSSYFSPDAHTFQSKFEHQMTLIDFIKLSTMITGIK